MRKVFSVRLIAALVCLMMPAASFAQQESDSAQPARVRVACVGDSITNGYFHSGYPAILQTMLGDGYEVRNFGFSARTLLRKGDRPYMSEQMYRDALDYDADYVIVMFGINDAKPENLVYLDEFDDDLREMLTSFRNGKASPKVFVCYPTTVYTIKWGIDDRVIVSRIMPIISSVAQEMGIDVIDMHTATRGVSPFFADSVHPDPQGSVLVAVEAYRAIMGTN